MKRKSRSMNDNSQAVRIPKEFQFDVDEIEIFKRGNEIILRKHLQTLAEAFDILASFVTN